MAATKNSKKKVHPVTARRSLRHRETSPLTSKYPLASSQSRRIGNGVKAVLKKIRPFIQMHGGDVRLVEIKGGVATVKIFGACIGCPLADLTYNKMVGTLIKEKVPEIKKLIFKSKFYGKS